MKVIHLLAVTPLLAGCGEELPLPSDKAAADIARIGVVPDCAQLRWAQQQDNRSGGLMVTAQYEVSSNCAHMWHEDLITAGFEPQMPHGEMISSSLPRALVALGGEGMAGVSYETDNLIAGLDVFQPEEAND